MKKIFTLLTGAALAGILSAQAENVTLYPEDYDDNSIASSSVSEISMDKDGNIVISDFLYSEAPISFKFDIPEPKKSSDITFTGNLDRSETYPYLQTPDGDYMDCWLYDYDGTDGWSEVFYPYVIEEGYSYVYRYDMSDSSNKYEYYGSICINGFKDDGTRYGWFYINFWFNMPTSSVNSIEIAESEKEEYYNLQGQRIQNPSKGLYIRVKGGKASKVLLN